MIIRITLYQRWLLAEAAGVDRFFGTPRGVLGAWERKQLSFFGIDTSQPEIRLLPARGERWPRCVEAMAEHRANASYRRMCA